VLMLAMCRPFCMGIFMRRLCSRSATCRRLAGTSNVPFSWSHEENIKRKKQTSLADLSVFTGGQEPDDSCEFKHCANGWRGAHVEHGSRVVGRMPPPAIERQYITGCEALYVCSNTLANHIGSDCVHLIEGECRRIRVGSKTVPIVVGGCVQVSVTDSGAALHEQPVTGAVKTAHYVASAISVAVNKFAGAAQSEFHAPGLLLPSFAQSRPASAERKRLSAQEEQMGAHLTI
jgi:hypothetical protein